MPSVGHCHLKRLEAPATWGLSKLGGKFAVRPLPGPPHENYLYLLSTSRWILLKKFFILTSR